MPQLSSHSSSAEDFFSDAGTYPANGSGEVTTPPNNDPQLASVMSELSRLSQSFVNSYQNLEGQVEKLNGQLESETKQKKYAMQEKQRLQSEKASLSDRLQNLLAIMPAGFVVIDGQGKVMDCNAKAVEILGRPLLGELWITVINRAFQPQEDDGHQVSLKDGRKIHIETRALDDEPGQLVVLTDLTKTRQLQADLSQQQKLSSMGKMIASLAHQIRTPLSAAILYGSHLNDNDLNEGLKQEFSNHLLERLHFMERQIDDMLSFVKGERKQKSQLLPKDLFNQLRERTNELPEFVKFEYHSDSVRDLLLLADQDAIIGAITNLIENACDACNQVKKPSIKVRFNVAKNLSIDVFDNGKGISREESKKIFEPFYTTRKSGNGLGLAIVHGIVIEHAGQIKVSSKVNVETHFEIKLPLKPAKVASVSVIEIQQEKIHGI